MPQAEILSFTGFSAVNEKRKISLRSQRLERSPAGAGQAGGKTFKLRFAIYYAIYFTDSVVILELFVI